MLEVGDIVMCTVERIAGTVVFVKIDENGQGSIVLSEIAPGRIRNLRNYVVPKKRIICKVLKVLGDHVSLSLRRVTPKEQKEIRERYKLEKSYKSILKTILKDEVDFIISQIKKQSSVLEFLEEAKTNPKPLEKLVNKEHAKKILDILQNQKQKKTIIKKEFSLTTIKPNGLTLIKELLKEAKGFEIKYLSAGIYSIKTEDENPKKADSKLKEILENLEKKAKKKNMEFSIKER